MSLSTAIRFLRMHYLKQFRITDPWFPPKDYKASEFNRGFPGPLLQAATVPISMLTLKINNHLKIFVNISQTECVSGRRHAHSSRPMVLRSACMTHSLHSHYRQPLPSHCSPIVAQFKLSLIVVFMVN